MVFAKVAPALLSVIVPTLVASDRAIADERMVIANEVITPQQSMVGGHFAHPNASSLSPSVTEINVDVPWANVEWQRLPLSPGDVISVQIPGTGGEEFSGEYEVNFNGSLDLPFLEPIRVTGLVPSDIEEQIRFVLLEKRFFRADLLKVDVQVLNYSPIQVSITGEVFDPGRLLVARETGILTESIENNQAESTPGGYPIERYLTSVLKSVGGVTPTADVSQIEVQRGSVSTRIDLSGVLSGSSVIDFPLVAGDEIIVPSSGVFERDLARPSQITPASIDLYVSNLTEPGNGSSVEGDGNVNVASFRYGTSLMQALVAIGCVGGTRTTNAGRQAVLIQTDSHTGTLSALEYDIPDLLDTESPSLEDNPLLMPDDAIACYDSRNTNIRGILDTISNFLNPLNLLRNLF